MCGIAGIFCENVYSEKHIKTVRKMLSTIRHRGPDGEGLLESENVVFGHRRLSIIDVSRNGDQPMTSRSGRLLITFNGEIYNYKELKSKYFSLDYNWGSSSDTEVLLELIEKIGIQKTVSAIEGMFSFAVWDNESKELYLARDRFGEKPLYYGIFEGELFFASELQALEAVLGKKLTISRTGIADYLQYSSISAPNSIFSQVNKLPAGHFLRASKPQETKVEKYWSLDSSFNANLNSSSVKLMESLESALARSCQNQMISDVPLGAFLSGGIDSTLITALMQSKSSTPIKTFSIGFDNPIYDESVHAKRIATFLKTDHTEYIATEADALSIAPDLMTIYDEPFADSSAIPTYILCKMAREHVKVCLTGDGADELFAGYPRYLAAPAMWKKVRVIPGRNSLSTILANVPVNVLKILSAMFANRVSKKNNISKDLVFEKFVKLVENFKANSFLEFYNGLQSTILDPNELIHEADYSSSRLEEFDSTISRLENMLRYDCKYYLESVILTKIDRASMSVSLETRSPMLDVTVAEIACQFTDDFRYFDGRGKYPLRTLLHKYIPAELMDRPKMGFSVPLAIWLRGPLSEWCNDLLSADRIRRQGILNPASVQKCMKNFDSGNNYESRKIWSLLMLQSWLDKRGI